ncbi:MAG: sugar phosphate isomerase/epimerase [Armatimonadetes bacterium]|nr:sugar phosphate isomerase/epimerase [Armatimonadota bacterium]
MFCALRDVMVFHAGYETLAEGMAECGVDTVELRYTKERKVVGPDTPKADGECVSAANPDEWQAVAESFAAAGLKVGGLLLATNFNADDRGDHIQWTVQAVRFAEVLGAGAVRIDSAMTGQGELPWAERVRLYADAVLEILDATSDSSVTLGIENHGLQGNDPAWMGAVVARVNSPRLGLTLDTGNFYWAGHPVERVYQIVETFAPHVVHTHCKNISYPGYLRNQQRPLGYEYGKYVCAIPDGDVDHGRLVQILAAAGYEGGLYIEDEGLGKAEDRKAQLKRDCEYLRDLTG